MKLCPNLRTAIDECRKLGKRFEWRHAGSHIKFYVNGVRLIISKNNENPDRVRKDIRRIIPKITLDRLF